ncbi:ribose 5-phosphate isomerase B [Candidatus Peregrinibacteria bacterium]|jgi:ribose 5-phosphate isomerase B|nr:ribose 5-phosphate isomerase B [Candidatus Peregrinibacteria bacterium]MBT7483914.1 ribose 5-phosphate isomerase B [Candidatus Peregrinibacteria bacterium]MBT7703059.1 ribose 5-phosphate isomerase B [Candidatus Peregrinibacteria bacterium]
MLIYIGSDHAGYNFKGVLKDHMEAQSHEVIDLGAFSEDSVDYPDIAREVAEKVYENHASFGILVCGTGTGMSIAANKHIGIRAASCTSEIMAQYARTHNNANVLCIGERILENEEDAKKIVDVFLGSEFEGGRHQDRVDKMMAMEKEGR